MPQYSLRSCFNKAEKTHLLNFTQVAYALLEKLPFKNQFGMAIQDVVQDINVIVLFFLL